MHETPRTYRRTITVTVAAAAAQPARVRAELSDTHHRMRGSSRPSREA